MTCPCNGACSACQTRDRIKTIDATISYLQQELLASKFIQRTGEKMMKLGYDPPPYSDRQSMKAMIKALQAEKLELEDEEDGDRHLEEDYSVREGSDADWTRPNHLMETPLNPDGESPET